MVIEPSTDIYILANCPLEPTYDHTIHWSDSAQQENYFLSLAKFKPTTEHGKATYQRVNIGYARVEVPVEKMYNCNYMMFKNEYFEDKWFYAFILSVEYVNNKTCLINYSIDVMQTWYWDYKLQECFVEREHSYTDKIGDNTIPEHLDIGEYEHHYLQRDSYFNWTEGDYVIAVASVFDENGNQDASTAGFYGGVYSGVNYSYFDTAAEATAWIENVVSMHDDGPDGILAIYMLPKIFEAVKNEEVPQRNRYFGNAEVGCNWTYVFGEKHGPRNKKLYTHPFNFLLIDTMAGNRAEYRYEFMNDPTKFTYILEGLMDCPPVCLLTPTNYNGVQMDREDAIALDSFPQCTYVTDSYRAWIASNYRTQNVAGLKDVLSGAGGVLGSLAGRSLGGVVSNLAGTALAVQSRIAEWETKETTANHANLTSKSAGMAFANKTYGYNLYNIRIRPEYASIIDDYFDRFGYAVHRNKVPNTNARLHWTFTKTMNCTVTGDVPGDDMERIISIYNRGITFWNNPSEIGDYSLTNTPRGELT